MFKCKCGYSPPEKEIISVAMRILGKRRSKKKAETSANNGRKNVSKKNYRR